METTRRITIHVALFGAIEFANMSCAILLGATSEQCSILIQEYTP